MRPPPSDALLSGRNVAPSVMATPAREPSNRSGTRCSFSATLPSTRRWPPPMKTPNVPSSAGMVVTCTCSLNFEINRSRSSSRSLGCWPRPRADAMSWLTLAMLEARLLTACTEACSSWLTWVWMKLSWSPASLKRSARSCARASTTPRVAPSAGWLARSDMAEKNCEIEWPMPCSPVLKAACSCCSLSLRTASMEASDLEPAASRVRKASCVRSTPTTLTPRPKKPTPVNCPCAVASIVFLARIAFHAGVGDVVAGRLHRRVAGRHRADADRKQCGAHDSVLRPSSVAGATSC